MKMTEGAAAFELKTHRELECPNWLKLAHPELFATPTFLGELPRCGCGMCAAKRNQANALQENMGNG